MKRFLLIALLPLAGCAMSPQGQDQFRQNFMMGLGATARQPAYYRQAPQPLPMPRTTICRNSFGSIVCESN